jgi:predicted secreted Zn-dependent protease
MKRIAMITARYTDCEEYDQRASSKKPAIYLLIISVFACCGVVGAEPIVTENTVHYDVRALSVAELHAQRQKLGPQQYFGNTQWRVHYDYRNGSDGRTCYVTSAQVTVGITYTMPRWANKLQATGALRDKWDKFYQRLQFHETGHKDIAVKNARLMEMGLLNLRAPSCRSLDARCKEVCDAFLDQTKKESVEYDRKTDHGRSQGAFLQ